MMQIEYYDHNQQKIVTIKLPERVDVVGIKISQQNFPDYIIPPLKIHVNTDMVQIVTDTPGKLTNMLGGLSYADLLQERDWEEYDDDEFKLKTEDEEE